MTDLEMTKLVAEAMGWEDLNYDGQIYCRMDGGLLQFDPLHDDAQCFALVKKLDLKLEKVSEHQVRTWVVNDDIKSSHFNLNRAICETVAKLRKAKAAA